MNVMENARKYAREGRVIELSASAAGVESVIDGDPSISNFPRVSPAAVEGREPASRVGLFASARACPVLSSVGVF